MYANLLTFPEALDNAAWTKSDTTVSANATADPLGGTGADKLLDVATTASHQVYQYVTVIPGRTYCFSVFAKGTDRNLQILPYNPTDGSPTAINCNVPAGTVGGVAGTGGVIPVGSGWNRFWVLATPTVTPTAMILGLMDLSFASFYLGDVTKGAFLFGARIELGSGPGTYNPPRRKTPVEASQLVRAIQRMPRSRR